MHKLRLIVCVLLILFPTHARAVGTDTLENTPGSNIIPESTKTDGMNISGYIAGSYNYLQDSNKFISGTHNRVFDLEESGPTFHQLGVTVAKQPKEGFGGLVNAILGRDALTTAAYGFDPRTGIDKVGVDVVQSFLQYANGPFTFIAGKYLTLPGVEAIDTTQNYNFSASYLAASEPGTELGVRGSYVMNPMLNFIGGITNGADNIRDTGRRKTIELGTVFTPNSRFALFFSAYSGQERIHMQTFTGPTGTRNLYDVVAKFNITKKLTFVVNYDYAMQTHAALPPSTNSLTEHDEHTDTRIGRVSWHGIAAYLNYQFTDKWRIALRGENFDDTNGYRTGVAQDLKSATLTLAYSPNKNIELRLETRRDFSNVNSFLERNLITPTDQQQSFALEAILKFG